MLHEGESRLLAETEAIRAREQGGIQSEAIRIFTLNLQ